MSFLSNFFSYMLHGNPPEPIAVPTLNEASVANGNILSWNNTGALSYNIYRDGIKIGNVPCVSHHDATEGSHIYHVTAVTEAGESMQSNVISVPPVLCVTDQESIDAAEERRALNIEQEINNNIEMASFLTFATKTASTEASTYTHPPMPDVVFLTPAKAQPHIEARKNHALTRRQRVKKLHNRR